MVDDLKTVLFKINVDHDYMAYAQLTDYAWNISLIDKIRGTSLEKVVSTLVLHWKSANLAFYSPRLMIECIKAMGVAFYEHKTPISTWLQLLAIRFETENPASLEGAQRNAVSQWLRSIDKEVTLQLSRIRTEEGDISEESMFNKFISESEFQINVWASQRQAFASLYFGYEFFVLSMFKLMCPGKSNYRITDNNLNTDFRNVFGSDIAEKCWLNSKRDIAEKVRHSIVHAGGTETSDLKKIKHKIELLDDVLQILPKDNRNLYSQLKEMANSLIDHCITQLAPNNL